MQGIHFFTEEHHTGIICLLSLALQCAVNSLPADCVLVIEGPQSLPYEPARSRKHHREHTRFLTLNPDFTQTRARRQVFRIITHNTLYKHRSAFCTMWKSQQYNTHTKLKLYHKSCVLSTLLYGSGCWHMTENGLSKLSSFHTKNLRKIFRIF